MRPNPGKLLRSAKLAPDQDLDAAAEEIVKVLQDERYPARISGTMQKRLKTKRYARLVSIEWGRDERDLVLVNTCKWSPELAEAITVDLLRIDQVDEGGDTLRRYYLASATEPPRMIRYTFTNDLRARLERIALCRVQYTATDQVVPLSKIPVVTELAFELARDYLGLGLPLEGIGEVSQIEEAIYRHLRRDMNRSRRMPKGEHVPHTSLLLLGLIYGELLGIGLKLSRKWKNDERAPFGLLLALKPGPGPKVLMHDPIGSVAKFYLGGEKESLVTHTWSILDQLKHSGK
jgi:hypothetical protein